MVELAGAHMTMICVTHEMGFARTVADTMVFIPNSQNERTKLFLSQVLAH
jgi:general L-amino acid transport system ATP-binding protein